LFLVNKTTNLSNLTIRDGVTISVSRVTCIPSTIQITSSTFSTIPIISSTSSTTNLPLNCDASIGLITINGSMRIDTTMQDFALYYQIDRIMTKFDINSCCSATNYIFNWNINTGSCMTFISVVITNPSDNSVIAPQYFVNDSIYISGYWYN
jgi:hypothetical protein